MAFDPLHEPLPLGCHPVDCRFSLEGGGIDAKLDHPRI
jgi:hypothetical protein